MEGFPPEIQDRRLSSNMSQYDLISLDHNQFEMFLQQFVLAIRFTKEKKSFPRKIDVKEDGRIVFQNKNE